ncbi:hypothetical protein QQS21_007900 [Conoideocrella luteorostrata]|uniref:Uncharacterized protein n=1 Tax=Conoideocrella luteorostrata TaxID=1105319 RepID=A0AAJ0CML8_9HYPO|nr:hypothetical protein QQS21_007900 [Conoideocrella luteorostrata]
MPEGGSNRLETNRLLVLQWLQETNTPWLLVLDNVEDPRIIRRLWPYDGPGAVIKTCGSEMTATSSPATLVLQVEPFSTEQGGELLLVQAGLSTTLQSNKDLSAEFSALLGGHTISLNVMARSIIAIKMNLGDFLTRFKQDPRSLRRRPRRRVHNLYYDKPNDLESIYLTEVGRYNACIQLLQHGFHHCKDEESIPHTNLCVMMGHVFCERGQGKRAFKYNDVVLRVRQQHLDPMHSEVAMPLSNSALSMVGCGQSLEEVTAMLKRSLEIDLHNPAEHHSKVLHLRHFNTAFALRALGRLEDAREHVDLATRYSVQEFGDKSRYLTM